MAACLEEAELPDGLKERGMLTLWCGRYRIAWLLHPQGLIRGIRRHCLKTAYIINWLRGENARICGSYGSGVHEQNTQ